MKEKNLTNVDLIEIGNSLVRDAFFEIDHRVISRKSLSRFLLVDGKPVLLKVSRLDYMPPCLFSDSIDDDLPF